MQVDLLDNKSIDRSTWDAFIDNSPEGEFYSLSFFLDAVAPGWSALVVSEKGNWKAVMPLHITKKPFWEQCLQPLSCRHSGIMFEERPFRNDYEAYSFKSKTVQSIVDAIPSGIADFNNYFSPAFDYPFPFYWNGFTLKTRYTYYLDLTLQEEELFGGMRKENRKRIRQLLDAGYHHRNNGTVANLLHLMEENLIKKKEVMSTSQAKIYKKLAEHLVNTNRAQVHLVENADGEPACAGLLVFHKDKATLFLSGRREEEVRQGAMTLLVWQMIGSSRGNARIFDFAGSMLEGVEAFNRGFGATPVGYLEILKNKLPFVSLWRK